MYSTEKWWFDISSSNRQRKIAHLSRQFEPEMHLGVVVVVVVLLLLLVNDPCASGNNIRAPMTFSFVSKRWSNVSVFITFEGNCLSVGNSSP